MELSRKDRKKLWGKSGGRCNMPSCRILLYNTINVGDEAHIFSNKPLGPRYNPNLQKYDTYDNAILLCKNCHTIIDKDEMTWTPEKLFQIKEEHEKWNINLINERISGSDFKIIGGHSSSNAKKKWLKEQERNKKRIKDWLFFHTVWYKDILRGEYQFDDWRTTEEINNIVHLGSLEIRNLCEIIDAIERDTNDQSVEKWRIKLTHYEKYDGDEIFEI